MYSELRYLEASKIVEELQNGLKFVDSKGIENINDYMNPKKKNGRRKINF